MIQLKLVNSIREGKNKINTDKVITNEILKKIIQKIRFYFYKIEK